jgi:hypothetical protein
MQHKHIPAARSAMLSFRMMEDAANPNELIRGLQVVVVFADGSEERLLVSTPPPSPKPVFENKRLNLTILAKYSGN